MFPEHEGAVLAVAFSPDGKRLATATLNPDKRGVLRIYDVATGKLLDSMVEHYAHIYSLAFSHDGRRLASASSDHWVGLWNIGPAGKFRDAPIKLEPIGKDSKPVRPDDTMQAVAFSPDGKILVSAGKDRAIRYWDPATGKELRSPMYHRGHPVRSAAFARHGESLLLVSCSGTLNEWGDGDGVVKFWSVARGEKALQVRQRCSLVSFWDPAAKAASWVVFDPQGRYDASKDGHVWWLHWVVNGEPVELSN
jgi:WD40 repeat protein